MGEYVAASLTLERPRSSHRAAGAFTFQGLPHVALMGTGGIPAGTSGRSSYPRRFSRSPARVAPSASGSSKNMDGGTLSSFIAWVSAVSDRASAARSESGSVSMVSR